MFVPLILSHIFLPLQTQIIAALGLKMTFPQILLDRIWHSTSPERFESIIQTKAILPNPNIDDSERWGTASGPEFFPFVRCINGVSLFDFRSFDKDEYSKKCPMSSWQAFVPFSKRINSVIWIEININTLKRSFIGSSEVRSLWYASKQHKRKYMPYIEAAHIGPLPVKAFKKVFQYNKKRKVFEELVY